MPSFDIVICGAGLGGLAAAIGLCQHGHKVTVLEAAAELNEVGAGIQIPPNSVRILDAYGIKSEIEAAVTKPSYINLRRYSTGAVLNGTDLSLMNSRYGYPYWLIHRADYQKILLNAAVAAGANVQFGKRIDSVDAEATTVTLEDGTVVSADLILGADGIRSRVRDSAVVPDEEVLPFASTNCAYRATVPRAKMMAHPELAALMTNVNSNCWLGYRRHVMAYPIRNGEMYNIVMSHPGRASVVGRWNEPGSVDEMRNHYKTFEPTVRTLLDQVDSASLLKWVLADLPILPRWTHNNVALIGDAAHAMLPYLAQGAAQAIEDGACICDELEKCKSAADIKDAMKSYEKRRKRRVEIIQQGARANSHIWHMPDGDEQAERDAIMAAPSSKKNPNQWSDPKFQKWMFGWNAFTDSFQSEIDLARL